MIEKNDLARILLYSGIFMAIYGSLDPWFLWGIYRYYQLVAFVPVAASLLVSRNFSHPLFNRTDWLYPTISCFAVLLVMALASGKNMNGVIMVFFSTVIYLSVFWLDIDDLQRMGVVFSKIMALMMCVSIPFYILYLLGFTLPHHHAFPENLDYSFENYYFFMVDDRFFSQLVPRFHSVFLEPSHLGMACLVLLYSQIGRWNTWYCRVLFLTLFMTMSLAAYICSVVMFFSAAWIKGKAVIGKLVLVVSLCGLIWGGSVFYNRGDNLLNVMVFERLNPDSETSEVGEENNRTTGVFKKEYQKMIDNDEWFFGKGSEAILRFGSGNAGYKVYIYTFGFVSVMFLLVFFFLALRTSPNRRAAISAAIMCFVSFIPHGIPLKYYFFIPLYISAFNMVCNGSSKADNS